ncbi:hypothetical protein LZ198_27655 [Myxococcus sp. K15C18031901]|uniref:hypothetical protein n=1 Tax=Myxococcus dinghuensis TaxID=2906761 RepID=UPI0020A73B96|nr:hypothetical protein [Myxococcus dinghuensis]MCP3102657.1 hypothetical protein [Myxococcus dinghuensis]
MPQHRGRLAALLLLAGAVLSCRAPEPPRPPPRVVLWAWERPEDLRFLEGQDVEVSVLLATLRLRPSRFLTFARQQPIRLPPGLRPCGTVRLEMQEGASLARYSPEQLREVAQRLTDLARVRDVAMLQLDFDVRESEHEAYLALLRETRELLGPSRRLSITGLASWCVAGGFVERAPVDEVVPQLFRMGPESPTWRERFARGPVASCGDSVGLAMDEWHVPPQGPSTLYLFNPHPWTRDALARAMTDLKP